MGGRGATLLVESKPATGPAALSTTNGGPKHGNGNGPAMPAPDGQRHTLRVSRDEGAQVLLFSSAPACAGREKKRRASAAAMV